MIAALLALFFIANRHAFSGYFSSDDLDTLTWARVIGPETFTSGFISPKLSHSNFRPAGALFYRLTYSAAAFEFRVWVAALFLLHSAVCLSLWLFLRRLGFAALPAAASALFYCFHPALFNAWWKPMYIFDVLCCLFSLFTLLSWISRRPVLAFLCFWTAFKSKELAVCLPVALIVLEYWLRQTGRPISPWRLIPFYAVSLNFGLQALFGNAAQHEPYRLHVSFDALRTTLPVYAPWLLMAAPAIFLRDRRIWIVLALLATAITILLLPGRLFTVYLYLPLTGAAIAMAILFTRWRAVLTFVTITVWLLWSYSLLRPYRRLEIEHAHERRAYVTSLLSHPQLLASSHYFLYDGKPAHMDPWGVEGALRLAGAPFGASVQPLEMTHGWQTRIPANAVAVSWDGTARLAALVSMQRLGSPAPYINTSNPALLPQLLEGFSHLDSGYRPIHGCTRVRLALPAHSSALHLAWRVDRISTPEEITLSIDNEWLGGFPCSRTGPYSTYWPVNRDPAESVIVEIASAGDLAISVRSISFR